jgi:eukaryotic-like serine/threonine-protein kinase
VAKYYEHHLIFAPRRPGVSLDGGTRMDPGTVIQQKYRLERCLGEGGMGSVWEAMNLRTQRAFALKLIRHSDEISEELQRRMLQEASVAGRLRHPNVIEVYDVGETDDGSPFLVMELLTGETLEHLLETRKQLDSMRSSAVGAEVSAALAAAHAAGVVHRDLKPANVFLHEEPGHGRIVKVLDFGVSKLIGPDATSATITGVPIGTPAYMSPEQAEGRSDVDARTDLWSVGVMLFEMVAGRLPFGGATAFAVVGEVLHAKIPRLREAQPDADPRLDAVIARCLVRDRARRIGSARELGAELESLLARSSSAVLADLDEEVTRSRSVELPSLPLTPTGGTLVPVRPATPPRTLLAIAASLLLLLGVLGTLLVEMLRGSDPAPALSASAAPAAFTSMAAVTAESVPLVVPSQSAAPEEPPVASASAAATGKKPPRRWVPACPKDKLLIDPVTGRTTCAAGKR